MAVRDRCAAGESRDAVAGRGVLHREVEECPHRLHPQLHLGDQRAQAREGSDRHAELLALQHVRLGGPDGPLGDADEGGAGEEVP